MKKVCAVFGLLLLINTALVLPAVARPTRGGGGSRPNVSRPAPSRPVSRPSRPVNVPNRPVNTPSRPINVPNRPVNTPNRPINVPNRPINTPNRPINVPNRPINNRPVINRPIGSGNTIINNRPININNINTRPAWVNRNWAVSRPWGGYGWYGGWTSPPWGWWTANTAIWGITTLASAAIISSSVNNAISNNVVYIPVPNSSYQLYYGTINPINTSQVEFAFGYQDQTFQVNADCEQGLLNGQPPSTAEEAELLNAACQIAFASF
nr:hypothetical protein [Synechococcus elongatus]QFZ92365.1 hypothetical protein EKO22_08380 [Synechococcus elongatus PCC 11802]